MGQRWKSSAVTHNAFQNIFVVLLNVGWLVQHSVHTAGISSQWLRKALGSHAISYNPPVHSVRFYSSPCKYVVKTAYSSTLTICAIMLGFIIDLIYFVCAKE